MCVFVCVCFCAAGMRRVLRRLERVRNVMKDLPPAATITDKNLVDILDTLDQKINDLLRIQAFLRSKVGPECLYYSVTFEQLSTAHYSVIYVYVQLIRIYLCNFYRCEAL